MTGRAALKQLQAFKSNYQRIPMQTKYIFWLPWTTVQTFLPPSFSLSLPFFVTDVAIHFTEDLITNLSSPYLLDPHCCLRKIEIAQVVVAEGLESREVDNKDLRLGRCVFFCFLFFVCFFGRSTHGLVTINVKMCYL